MNKMSLYYILYHLVIEIFLFCMILSQLLIELFILYEIRSIDTNKSTEILLSSCIKHMYIYACMYM